MRLDPETFAWASFAASVFVLMGVTLAADAEDYARAASSWPGPAGGREALVSAYRGAGAFFCVAAAGVVWAASRKPIHFDRPGRLALAAVFGAVGFGLVARKLTRPPALPGALEADGTLAPDDAGTLGRKAAAAARWLLAADFAAFACFLLTRREGP